MTVPAIVDASKFFLIVLSLALSLTACNRRGSTPEQAESGAAAPPAAPASMDASRASTLSTRYASGASGVSIGSRIDDSILTTKVKTALMATREIKGADISVETRNGEVMLSGYVASTEQGEKAIGAVRRVDGVTAVGSKLAVRK